MPPLRRSVCEIALANFGNAEAAQLVEFAVILPLLMVIIVGIFDFSQAFNLKQKLANAAFQGARLGSSEPTTDLAQAAPLTITAIRDVVDTYLNRAGINDCGLGAISATVPPPPLTWTATGTCFGSSNLKLTIQRGYTFNATVNAAQVKVVSTKVTISYPYQWQFNRVIGLLVSGASYAGPPQITSSVVVPNQD